MKEKVWFFGSRISKLIKPDMVFIATMVLIIAAEFFAISVLSYLGTFSRYMADDYCEIVILRDMPLLSTIFNNYLKGGYRASNRFSNLLFIGMSEMMGRYNVQILLSLMILVWLVGLVWSVNQSRKLAGICLPALMDYYLAMTVVFFSAWQAPNLFQTFLWRSSMATHFAPLVFIPLLSGFVLSQIRSAKRPALWISLTVFLASFLIGGFSEPSTSMMIVIITILFPSVWRWDDVSKKRSAVNLLLCSFMGAFLAMSVMFFAPGNLLHGTTSFTNLITIFVQTFLLTFDFLVDTVRTLPLPSLISALTSFLVFFYIFMILENQTLIPFRKRKIWKLFIYTPFILYLLVAASFAPGVYGQAYPPERALFLGRLVMTMALIFEGALLGVLCAYNRILFSRRQLLVLLANVALLVLVFYPLRAGWVLFAEVPKYQQWASKWDRREAEIDKTITKGEQDLVVRLLPPRGGVKEIDGDVRHWVNRCVAAYYEVNTIRSVPMGDE